MVYGSECIYEVVLLKFTAMSSINRHKEGNEDERDDHMHGSRRSRAKDSILVSIYRMCLVLSDIP